MPTPLISIVMPIYNARETLREAVDSVLNQEYDEIEIILVNDGSTDDSGLLCEQYEREHAFVKYIPFRHNNGLSFARNAGFQQVEGAYVWFMDADDTALPGALKKISYEIETFRPDVILFGIEEAYRDAAEKTTYQKTILPSAGRFEGRGVREQALPLEKKTLLGYAWNKLYRVDRLREWDIHFERHTLHEDFFLNIEIFERAGSLSLIDEALYQYNIRSGKNLTARFIPNYFEDCHRRVEEMVRRLEQWKMLGPSELNALAGFYARYLFSALVRNSDPRMRMDAKARRAWLEGAYRDPLYKKLAGSMSALSFPASAVCALLRSRRVKLTVGVSGLSYFVRNRLPRVFARLKQSQ